VADITRWKATELRQFLLYTGPVGLWQVLPEPLYQNFLLLLVGMSLLINPKLCDKYCDYAKSLLITCVENMKVLYGMGMMVYNVHGLVHLADDARVFGALDNLAAFPYENKLKSIKRLVRKPSFVLQQISRRLREKQRVSSLSMRKKIFNDTYFKREHSLGPVLEGMECAKQYRLMCLNGSDISLNVGDDCVAKSDGKPCIVRNILCNGAHTFVVVENFKRVSSFLDYTLPSSSINICQCNHLTGVLEVINTADVLCKCIRLPPKDESFVVFPLLHNA
jgi:hypothetical protein